ncbi:MAG: leucine-rich repeat domain-containing protein [Lachnospiraceae bacterium]|nr:leucine-rich repeat domain-containing protein [Lachnospiraceae bacterium]
MKGFKSLGCLLALLLAAVILFPATAKAASVEINEENFPDEGLRECLKELDVDVDQDGWLSTSEIKETTKLYCSGYSIKKLDGIEKFTNLRELYCYSNKLTTKNLSSALAKLTKLEVLDCSDNKLTKLDVTILDDLEKLNCSENLLTELTISGNKELERLECQNNELTALDVSKNTKLVLLNCSDNALTTLSVTKNPELRALLCSGNSISTLNVTKNPELLILRCYDNKLTKLDISKNPNVHILVCYGNNITTLDIHLQDRLVWSYTKPESEWSNDECASYFYDDPHAPAEFYYLEDEEDVSDSGLECCLQVKPTTKIVCKPKITVPAETTKKTVTVGDKVSLKVTAKSTTTLTYQWYYKTSSKGSYKKITAASGTKATYTFTAKEKHNGYYYLCKVRNQYGYTNSKVYKLKVVEAPEITSPTAASTKKVAAGKTATFKVTATGAETYQWQYRTSKTGSWKNVKAASGKTATYKLYNTTSKYNGYQYRCKVSNAAGKAVYSPIYTLKVTS